MGIYCIMSFLSNMFKICLLIIVDKGNGNIWNRQGKKKKYGKISVKVLPTGGRLPNKRSTKHIHIQQFSMKFLLRSLYAHNSLLYFHTHIGKCTNMPYSVDSITFKFEDKKTAKRTAIFRYRSTTRQEQMLQPLRAYHQVMQVRDMSSEHSVFVMELFALAEDNCSK